MEVGVIAERRRGGKDGGRGDRGAEERRKGWRSG